MFLLVGIVFAQPPLYHEFYGNVKCDNGDSIADGTSLLIKLDDSDYSNILVVNGGYHIIIQGDLNNIDDAVEFYIEEELVGSSIFESFGFSNLDLVSECVGTYCGDGDCNGGETCSSCVADCGVCQDDDDDGDGGGGSSDSECEDGVDNDNDGLIDYPLDPGCVNSNDDNETNINNVFGGSCSNECIAGAFSCLTNISYKECGHYDNDNCLEWSNSFNCDDGYVCDEEQKGCILENLNGEGGQFPFDNFLSQIFREGIIPYAIIVGIIIFLIVGIWLIIMNRHRIPFHKVTFLKKEDDSRFYKLNKK